MGSPRPGCSPTRSLRCGRPRPLADHPSNARFYSYGDLPLGPHLEELNRHVLERFERSDGALTAVGDVHRWSEPKKMSTTCPEDAVSADPDRPVRQL